MEETFELGTVSCPSGNLLLIDGGYLGLWSGERSPADIEPASLGIDDPATAADLLGAIDFAVTGTDASEAVRTFDRQPGSRLHDIPASQAAECEAAFDEHCRTAGLDARLEALPVREPHAHRARRTAAEGGGSFMMFGVPVVVMGGVPRSQRLPVLATRAGDGNGAWAPWSEMAIRMREGQVQTSVSLGDIGVDWARVFFGDADALSAWQHDEPVDGLADVAFWGAAADEAATAFAAPALGEPGEDGVRGWTGLTTSEAMDKTRALLRWKDETGGRMAVDFRPHSHHWQIMRKVRASPLEAGSMEIGNARVLCAMTSWGDGYFPVVADFDASGELLAVRVRFADVV
ncbi:hypothetical protein ACHGLA_01030 [Streptomyces sp. YH02]|uniref:hypothetical protein n=1 Tax=Streptomyces sp. YH02 TaxID=3256999 RepID=UPI003757EFD0